MIILSRYLISGHSMEPTLKENQIVLVSSLPYLFSNPKVQDIVAVKIHQTILIKRITKISDKKYFVQGDNQRDSTDSRKFGMIDKVQIIGKVISS